MQHLQKVFISYDRSTQSGAILGIGNTSSLIKPEMSGYVFHFDSLK